MVETTSKPGQLKAKFRILDGEIEAAAKYLLATFAPRWGTPCTTIEAVRAKVEKDIARAVFGLRRGGHESDPDDWYETSTGGMTVRAEAADDGGLPFVTLKLAPFTAHPYAYVEMELSC